MAERPATPCSSAEEKSCKEAPLQRALALAMARSIDPNGNTELTRALRVSMEEQRTSQQAMARSTDLNDNPELTRALRALIEEQKTRQHAMARSMDLTMTMSWPGLSGCRCKNRVPGTLLRAVVNRTRPWSPRPPAARMRRSRCREPCP